MPDFAAGIGLLATGVPAPAATAVEEPETAAVAAGDLSTEAPRVFIQPGEMSEPAILPAMDAAGEIFGEPYIALALA